MNKDRLIEIKKRLLALGLAGIMLGTTGCSSKKDGNDIPKISPISIEYSNVENYYKNAIRDGKATKLYKSKNTFLLFDKNTYDVKEYIFDTVLYNLGCQIYELKSEKLIIYGNGIATRYNYEYYEYLVNNNYQVCLAEVSNYIEGYDNKDYYSLDEIKKLEPQIAESLKIINETIKK